MKAAHSLRILIRLLVSSIINNGGIAGPAPLDALPGMRHAPKSERRKDMKVIKDYWQDG